MTNPEVPQVPSQQEQEQFKARYIETADRSYLNERLIVPTVPPHLHYEWLGTDDFSQFNAQSRGFVDGSEFLTPDSIMHYTPVGGVIGDVKLMVIPKWKYEAMKKIDDEKAAQQGGLTQKEYNYRQNALNMGLGVDRDRTETEVLSGNQADVKIKTTSSE